MNYIIYTLLTLGIGIASIILSLAAIYSRIIHRKEQDQDED